MKAAILVADGFNDLEVFHPWFRLREEGIVVTLAGPGPGIVTGQHGYRVDVDVPLFELDPAQHDLLIIPGGRAPERLRVREEAVDLARTFMDGEKVVVAICHGPQLLISAGVLSGRTLTSTPYIRDDLRMAGAHYRDEAVVMDGNLITARGTADLPKMSQRLMSLLSART